MLDKLKNIWIVLPFFKKALIISFVTAFFMWIFFLSPNISKLKKAKVQADASNLKLQQERLKLIKAQKEIKELKTYKQKSKDIENKLSDFKGSLIPLNDIIKITDILTFKEGSIVYVSFLTNSFVDKKLYQALPIEINIESSYFLLGEYLKFIEETDYIIDFKQITASKKQGSYNTVETKLLVDCYVAK